MKLNFKNCLPKANGFSSLEAKIIEAFNFLFANKDEGEGIVISTANAMSLHGIPEFTIVEKDLDDVNPQQYCSFITITRNTELVSKLINLREQTEDYQDRVISHDINFYETHFYLTVLKSRIEKVERDYLEMTNIMQVRIDEGPFAGLAFIVSVTFDITRIDPTLGGVVCLSSVKRTGLYTSSGCLVID